MCVENRGRGLGRLESINLHELVVSIDALEMPEILSVSLLLGASRPQTIRKVLQLSATAGVTSVTVVGSERGEKSYLSSHILRAEEATVEFEKGAEQGGVSHLPQFAVAVSLTRYLADSHRPANEVALCFDRSGTDSVARGAGINNLPVTVAIGSEAGWSAEELRTLREHGFVLVTLGPYEFRVEQALGLALGQILAQISHYK